MINPERLQKNAAGCGLALTGEQLELLDRYAERLVETYAHFNLTAITDPEGIENKHFILKKQTFSTIYTAVIFSRRFFIFIPAVFD